MLFPPAVQNYVKAAENQLQRVMKLFLQSSGRYLVECSIYCMERANRLLALNIKCLRIVFSLVLRAWLTRTKRDCEL